MEELFGDGGSMRGGTTRSHKSSTSLGGAADLGVPLHCTLFLFDDQLVIAKRPSAQVSGRKLTGLDDISKLVKSGGGVAVKEKDGVKKERLSFRGAMDIMALTGLDMGSGDFQLVFDGSTPGAPVFTDQTDKWTGRAVRTYGTIHPPAPIGLNPTLARTDKERFLANLWTAQALARTRTRHKIFEPICRALVAEDDVSVESMAVKAYWNLWDRASWTATERKVKVVIQLTEDENVPELHLPQEGGPLLIIRVEALSGAVCKVQALTPAGHEVLRTATSVSEINDKIIEASEFSAA